MKRGTEIPSLKRLIVSLERAGKKNKAGIWLAVARRLSVPARRRAEVNLNKLNGLAREGQTLLVPGKVLSIGGISRKFSVAAYSYSKAAREKLARAGCKAMEVDELLSENPKGSNVVLVV